MSAYVIADISVTDPVSYQEYSRQVLATVDAHGGRFIVRGGPIARLDGEWGANRVVVIEFDSVGQARGWYESPEYQAILPLRLQNSNGRVILVEGA